MGGKPSDRKGVVFLGVVFFFKRVEKVFLGFVWCFFLSCLHGIFFGFPVRAYDKSCDLLFPRNPWPGESVYCATSTRQASGRAFFFGMVGLRRSPINQEVFYF